MTNQEREALGAEVAEWIGSTYTQHRGDTGAPEQWVKTSVARLGYAVAATLETRLAADRAERAAPVVQLGATGSAYDTPGTRRAYTYDHQPGNAIAWQLGKAAAQANAARGGDFIDGGLSLLKALADQGFGVVNVGEVIPSSGQGGS